MKLPEKVKEWRGAPSLSLAESLTTNKRGVESRVSRSQYVSIIAVCVHDKHPYIKKDLIIAVRLHVVVVSDTPTT